ncbi:hypothetical protein [Methanothrix sp.]|uniref:hypothetical protein n=1 Tax=Methanothrix sp. TaxID=90426 RepID=UPI00345EB2F3
MNTRYKVALLLCAMMLIATAPPAFGTIIYGGANVEVPTSTPATAVGDAGTLNNRAGALDFTVPKMAGWPAVMNTVNNRIVVDPRAAGAFAKYCRSWVFTGATLPARTQGDAAAEWTGTLAPASASEVLDTADTIIMSASANGQSHSEVHATNAAGTIPTTAQTLIDAWAGSRIAGGFVNPWDRDLYGNAQITSTAQTNAAGSVSTGATAAGYTGNDEPQPYAVAGFSAQRITMSSGSTRVPGAISGTVTGTTSVEIANALGGPVAARAPGWAAGYATANTYAMAAASDLPNTRSYSLSDIRSSARATRPTTNGQTAVLARSDGTASSEAWDSSRNWASPTAPGTGNSITSVTGKTVAQATAMRTGDIIFGDGLPLGPAGTILAARSPDGLQTWSQMLAVAAKGQSVIQAPTPDERDAFTFADTSARVTRANGNTADANRAISATWLGSAAATDANLPLTSGASLNAKSAETQSGFNTEATLSNIGMSSGAHAKGTTTGQGSTATLATKARFTGAGVGPQQVAIGNALAYPGGNPILNGFVTNGPGFTGQGWDDAGSYIIAGTQDATTTGSSGTYRLTAQPTDVREWVTGASLLNNNWILQRPAPLNWQKPQTVNAVPNLQEIPVAGRNPDSYQWSGDMTGPS